MSLKEQILRDNPKMSVTETTEELEESGSEFWGIERVASRRAIMLDVRLKGGKFYALPYSYMTKVKFDPSEGLEIYISGNYVKITGRNLHEIYIQLLRHRVNFIQANISDIDITDENKTYIKDIEVTEDVP